VAWLNVRPNAFWLDVGCGTGALSQTIVERCSPRALLGIDRSPGFVQAASAAVARPAAFAVADAQGLPVRTASIDAAVSALALNFIPDVRQAAAEVVRVVRPAGTVAAYVWDYADGMQFMRVFWDEAVALRQEASRLDEAHRFPICRADPLRELFESVGLDAVSVAPIDAATVFEDFADYWSPFLGGQGPAPAYVMSLSEADREALRQRLEQRLAPDPGTPIRLTARAWAVKGRRAT
jgi:SAM-dependent methyltransferase